MRGRGKRLTAQGALCSLVAGYALEKIMSDEKIDQLWRQREKDLIEDINTSIEYYSKQASRARGCHRTIGVTVLIGSVLAPVAVVSSAGTTAGLALFGVADERLAQVAVVITIVLSLCEGLRRLFEFDQRWITCVVAKEQLRRLRDVYLDEQIADAVGAENWVSKLTSLRSAVNETRTQEEVGFFKRLNEARMDPA